jgi:hypothetical protein
MTNGASPSLRLASGTAAHRWRRIVPALALAALAAAVLVNRPRKQSAVAIDQQFAVQSYAGANECSGCHAREAQSFSATAHARALFRGDSEQARSMLAGRATPDSATGASTRLPIAFRADGNQLIAELSGDGGGDRVPIDWCFGSGEFGTTFVTLLEDSFGHTRLLEHHWSWFRDGDLLALTPGHEPTGSETGWERFGSVTEPSTTRHCFSCHSTTFQYASGKLDSTSIVAGIQCERCHGPRKEHVGAMLRTSSGRTAGVSRPVGQTLSARQRVYACGECHRRPDEISDEIRPDNPIIARFPSVGLLQSKCFLATEAKGTLTCTTCHDPHRSERPSLSAFDSRCQECHSLARDLHNVPCPIDTAGRNCVECHMPKVRLHPHLQFTDHWIRRHPLDSPESPGR